MFRHGFRPNQSGVSLVEVLVSLLLLSTAVIGFAALQVRAVSTTNTASYRTQAVGIAQDLSERIRANFTEQGTYNTPANWGATPAQDCQANTCTPAQMVSYDIRITKQLAAATLPNGDVAVRPCAGVASLMCIYVSWNETTTNNNGAEKSCGAATGSYTSINSECVIMEAY